MQREVKRNKKNDIILFSFSNLQVNTKVKKLFFHTIRVKFIANIRLFASYSVNMKKEVEYEEEYVDVRSLPLRPPQPAAPPEKASRRVWHPVMWDSAVPAPLEQSEQQEQVRWLCKIYF